MPVRSRHRERNGVPVRRERPAFVLAGRAWVGSRLQSIELGFGVEGQIVAIGRQLRGDARRDVGEAVMLPSAVDLHAHFRDPGPADSVESFASGTVEAALGGVGVAVDMPNTEPPTVDVASLAEKKARTRHQLAVDAVLFAALTSTTRVSALSEVAGGFKLYMSPTPGVESPPWDPELVRLLEAIANEGLALSVHAEDPTLFGELSRVESVAGWNIARPPESERSAVDRLLSASPPGLRLHVAHVTDPAVAKRLAEAGHSFEATPQHLIEHLRPGLDARWKVNPPIRPAELQGALWERFRRGDIPILASDHAPHSVEAKSLPFAKAPSGMPGIETMLPLMLARVRSGDLALPVLLRASSDRPARLLGLPCGRLSLGHRANVLVVDFRNRTEVRAERLRAPCGWSAFEGAPAIFPREHYLGGVRIVEDGEYIGARVGTIVRPEYAPRSAERIEL